MAWCTHCVEDRPIQRQTFESRCAFCNQVHEGNHHSDCRGPVPGALDVYTFCNTPVFAKAANETHYNELKFKEDLIPNSDWGLLMRNGAKNLTEEEAKSVVDHIRAKEGAQATKRLQKLNSSHTFSEAANIVLQSGRELGTIAPASGCMALILLPLLISAGYFIIR